MPASFVIHVGIKGSSFVELFVLSYRVLRQAALVLLPLFLRKRTPLP